MARAGRVSEAQVVDLVGLLDDVRDGHVVMPRPYELTWTDEQRMELLSSVKDDLPIGGLLLWRTRLPLAARSFDDSEGAYPPLPAADPVRGGDSIRSYVIDGYNRLATLYDALYQSPSPVIYDLLGERFMVEPETSPWHLPLHELLDGRALRHFQRRLFIKAHDSRSGVAPASGKQWRTRADALGAVFARYRLPLMIMTTDDTMPVRMALERLVRPSSTPGVDLSETFERWTDARGLAR